MKNNFLSIVMLALLGLCFSFCKTPDPCDSVGCGPNQICDNGTCKCDNFSYKIGNGCIAKSEQTYFFGNKGCNMLLDTFTLKVVQDKNKPSIATFEKSARAGLSYATVSTTGDFYPGQGGVNGKPPTADSIRVFNVFYEGKVKGVSCKNEVTGKLQNNITGSTVPKLELTVRFYDAKDATKTIETCKLTMVQ